MGVSRVSLWRTINCCLSVIVIVSRSLKLDSLCAVFHIFILSRLFQLFLLSHFFFILLPLPCIPLPHQLSLSIFPHRHQRCNFITHHIQRPLSVCVYSAVSHYAFSDIVKRGDICPLKSFLSLTVSVGLAQIVLFVLLPRRWEELSEGLLSAYLLMSKRVWVFEEYSERFISFDRAQLFSNAFLHLSTSPEKSHWFQREQISRWFNLWSDFWHSDSQRC